MYLGIKTEKSLYWKFYLHDPVFKLSRANTVLSKIMYFATSYTLTSVYLAKFNANVNYVRTAWGLTRYLQHEVSIIQKETIRIINFSPYIKHTSGLFEKCNF